MRPSRHLALSTVAGGAVWAITGEPLALPLTVGAGVLVDVDHSPDLWWNLALRREPVAVYLLHSWEWLAGLMVVGVLTGSPWWLSAVVVGFGLHLLTDHLFNHGGRWSYSLIYRASKGFRMAKLAPGWEVDQTYEVLRKEVPVAVMLIEWWRRRSPSPVRSAAPNRRHQTDVDD